MLAQFNLGQDLQHHSPHSSTSPLELDSAFWDHSEALPQLLPKSCAPAGTHSGQLSSLLLCHRSDNRKDHGSLPFGTGVN